MAKPELFDQIKPGGRDDIVRARIRHAEAVLEPFKRKVYSNRKLVAGDFSSILDAPAAAADGPEDQKKLAEFYDFIVNSYDEAYTNRILQHVKQVLMQVTFASPEVEFEDLKFEEAAVNSGWVKQRLAEAPLGCGAKDEMRLGLLDYITGGIGWSGVCITRDYPVLRVNDSLDMKWDVHAPTLSKIKWASCTYREPLYYWISVFGAKAFTEYLSKDAVQLDQILALEYYYDIDTARNGSFYVFIRGDNVEGINQKPVYSGDNPHYFNVHGRRVPFIPHDPIFFLALPSVRQPISMVELMLPAQVALWKQERYENLVVERGAPFYQGKKGTLKGEALENFQRGETGAYVEFDESPVLPAQGIQLDASLGERRSYYERAFTSAAGTNPYANGVTQEGTDFAAEVNQIASMSGLTTAYVSRDHAAWWERSVRKFIAVGALNDDMPCSIQVGDVQLDFDAYKPVKMFLRPLADLVISEETTQFQPKAARVADAVKDMEIAAQVQAIFPNALAKAYENYLRARGEKNIAQYLQPPDPAQTPMGAALSSTAQ